MLASRELGPTVFFTVRTVSCTDMANIQAINASMPVQCQAVQDVRRGAHLRPTIATSGIQEVWRGTGLETKHISAVCLVTGCHVVLLNMDD